MAPVAAAVNIRTCVHKHVRGGGWLRFHRPIKLFHSMFLLVLKILGVFCFTQFFSEFTATFVEKKPNSYPISGENSRLFRKSEISTPSNKFSLKNSTKSHVCEAIPRQSVNFPRHISCDKKKRGRSTTQQ